MNCWLKQLAGVIGTATLLAVSTLPGITQETRIVFHRADSTLYDQRLYDGMQRSIGHVFMEHKDLKLYCDSAHFDQESNRMIGYSRLHVIKADTIHIFAQFMDYNGTTEKARLSGNVVMDNGQVIVRAPIMDYDMQEEVAWYFGGGQIIDTTNTVESFWGYYYVSINEFYFKDDVILSNEESTLLTDTLKYNSETEEMWFNGYTQIFGDTNYVACNQGYYDSQNSFSLFEKEVFMQSGAQILRGDSLAYQRNTGDTEVYYQVEMEDTVEQMVIQGEHLSFNEQTDWFRMTEEVLFMLDQSGDTLFMHADTLLSYRDTAVNSRHIEAYPKVQFYREDMQGRCNRLDYVLSDSLIFLYDQPVIWQEESQLTADSIRLKLQEGGLESMNMMGSGFLITREDSVKYNQIKGKRIDGWFVNDKLHSVLVEGNGECLFYPKDEDDFIGMYYCVSSRIRIRFDGQQIDKVSFIGDPNPKLVPLKQVTESEKFLEKFVWMEEERPTSAQSIFIWK